MFGLTGVGVNCACGLRVSGTDSAGGGALEKVTVVAFPLTGVVVMVVVVGVLLKEVLIVGVVMVVVVLIPVFGVVMTVLDAVMEDEDACACAMAGASSPKSTGRHATIRDVQVIPRPPQRAVPAWRPGRPSRPLLLPLLCSLSARGPLPFTGSPGRPG